MTGFKTFICSCVYFHFHTDDGLSRNRNVCTYCYAHKIMKFITFALVFSFILMLHQENVDPSRPPNIIKQQIKSHPYLVRMPPITDSNMIRGVIPFIKTFPADNSTYQTPSHNPKDPRNIQWNQQPLRWDQLHQ